MENKYIFPFFNMNFNHKLSILYIKNKVGILSIKLPTKYFINLKKNLISFIFLDKYRYQSFLALIFSGYLSLKILYILRLKIKGLGYRIRKVTKNLFYLFFNFTNIIYLYIPKNIIIKWYKKRIILISYNFKLMKHLISTILILKKLGPYQIRGLKYPRQIIMIKKRKKNF